jgi:hypothetical protein
MIMVYCGFGAFLIMTLVICAFLRRSGEDSVAGIEYTETMTGPLVEDPTLSKECLIMI